MSGTKSAQERGTAGLASRSVKEEAQMKRFAIQLMNDESGQDLIEYALLAGFISLVAVVAITNVGTGVNAVYGNVESQVAAIPGGGS